MHKHLKVNKKNTENTADISSNLLFRTTKPALDAGFRVSGSIGDTIRDTAMKKVKPYRDVALNTTGNKWYVEFKYLIPKELRPIYKNRKWWRFKKYNDINIVKTQEYGRSLRLAWENALDKGYNPFKPDSQAIFRKYSPAPQKKEWTAKQAFLFFKQKWEGRGLEPESLSKYERLVDRFGEWIGNDVLASQLTSEHMEAFLDHIKNTFNYSKRTYNNDRGFLGTVIKFLKSKKIINSDIDLPDKLKTKSKKHKYYDDRTYSRLKKVLLEKDPYLYFAFQTVYYLCIRSEKEIGNLQVRDILPDRGQVFINHEGKTGERYIPMCKEMLDIFKARKILSYPPHYYVFSTPAKGKFLKDGAPGKDRLARGFLSRRFSRRRAEIGINRDFTLYGAKHTRVIHLKHDGARDSDIMALTGHESYVAFAAYLRDLGLTAHVEDLHKFARQI